MLIGVFVALGTMGVDTSAIMAGGAVLLVGIGFGLQKLAENFISGLLLLLERPVRKGDFIDVGGVLGTVEDIGLRATHVISRDGVTMIVPNASLVTVDGDQPQRADELAPDLDQGRRRVRHRSRPGGRGARRASRRPSRSSSTSRRAEVRHHGFGDSSIELALVVWIAEARDELIVAIKLRFAIARAFRAAQHRDPAAAARGPSPSAVRAGMKAKRKPAPPPKRAESLSLAETRALAIAAQRLAGPRPKAVTRPMLRALVEQLGVIQIDSVNVLSRSHYLPAFSRLGAYDRDALDALAFDPPRALFEYWGHEASLLPVDAPSDCFGCAWPTRANDAWGQMRRMAKKQQDVHRRRAARRRRARTDRGGRDRARRGEEEASEGGWWEWSDTKTAIEWLFWSGQVTSARRRSFERLYDLPERVLPPEVHRPRRRRRSPTRIARCSSARPRAIGGRHRGRPARLLSARARAVARRDRGARRGRHARSPRTSRVGRSSRIAIATRAPPRSIRIARPLLSPFDKLIWMRDRTERLFGMRFRLEIYVPKPKRVHGYYVLPFLLGDQLVARVDLKADRHSGTLLVHAAHAETEVAKPAVAVALAGELRALAKWLGLAQVKAARSGDLGRELSRACK